MAPPRRQDLSTAQNGTIRGAHGGTQQLGAAAMRRLGRQEGAGGGQPNDQITPYQSPQSGSQPTGLSPTTEFSAQPAIARLGRPQMETDYAGLLGRASPPNGEGFGGLMPPLTGADVGNIQTAIQSLQGQLGMPPGQDTSPAQSMIDHALGRMIPLGQGSPTTTMPGQTPGASGAVAPGAPMPSQPGAPRPGPVSPGGPFANQGATPGIVPGSRGSQMGAKPLPGAGPGAGAGLGGSRGRPPVLPRTPVNAGQGNPYESLLARVRGGGGGMRY